MQNVLQCFLYEFSHHPKTIVEGKAPIFQTDAAFFTEAGFKKMIRGGELQMDVNSIEVTARLTDSPAVFFVSCPEQLNK